MPDLIFHHYPMSPFAEKIRLIFGIKQLSWKSVQIPRVLPKPDVVALTGGYRKTPILQIGADIYCDTALIARKLDQLVPTPPLYPTDGAASAEAIAAWADSTLFNAAVALAFQPNMISQWWAGDEKELQTFAADRAAMRQGATLPRTSLDVARAMVSRFLTSFNAQCESGRKYVNGGLSPSIADFSVFHPLWFIWTKAGVRDVLEPYPAVQSWLEALAAVGHGKAEEISSADAIAVANANTTTVSEGKNCLDKFSLGDDIAIQPTDYGIDPVRGRLIYSDEFETVLLRTDDRVGEVAVHFPRVNYAVLSPEKIA